MVSRGFVIGLMFIAACGGESAIAPRPLPTGPAPTDTADVTVATGSRGADIPADFLGFSFEVEALKDTELTNPSYAAAAALLGPGIVRFGGNSVDRSTWSPNPPAGNDTDLTGIDFDRGITFAHRAGWTMYLGINLAAFSPDTFAAEAAYATGRPGASGVLTAIEIGNEPDVFAGFDYRTLAYDGDSVASDYAAYDTALARLAPGVAHVGPAMCCRPDVFSMFLSDGGARDLASLTYHHYPTSAVNNPTPGGILSPGLMAKTAKLLDEIVADAENVGLPLRMAESNSTSGGGTRGTSDVFASSLWGLDYMYTLVEHGVVGVNFHGAPNDWIYSPLVDSAGVGIVARPLFYAMLAFHAGAIGRSVPTTISAHANITAHSVLAGDGTLHVTVINKDTVSAVLARIAPASSYRSATVQFLTAPSIHDEYGVTFAGAKVSSGGAWTPAAPYAVPAANGTFAVPLSPASAAVVTLTR